MNGHGLRLQRGMKKTCCALGGLRGRRNASPPHSKAGLLSTLFRMRLRLGFSTDSNRHGERRRTIAGGGIMAASRAIVAPRKGFEI